MVKGNFPGGLKPDNITNTENQDGELETQIDSTEVIGDFETDEGDWFTNIISNSLSVDAQSGNSDRGNYAWMLQYDNTTTGQAQKEITRDLTNVQTLKFWVDISLGTSSEVAMKVAGTKEYSKTSNVTETVSVDVSGYSGNTKIAYFLDSNDSSAYESAIMDNVRLITSRKAEKVNSGAGN